MHIEPTHEVAFLLLLGLRIEASSMCETSLIVCRLDNDSSTGDMWHHQWFPAHGHISRPVIVIRRDQILRRLFRCLPQIGLLVGALP